jgi:uroporphyrin-3 C-methyltransferase
MSLQIEAILGRVDTLPLAFEHKPATPPAPPPAKPAAPKTPAKSPVRGKGASSAPMSAPVAAPANAEPGIGEKLAALTSEFVDGFRSLVRIERLDTPDAALLAPAQVNYLRENIRLRLLSARLALLQRDGRVFAEDIQQARLWLERYFDMKEPTVASTVEELRQMESARLVVELPQLTETEAALRRLRPAR